MFGDFEKIKQEENNKYYFLIGQRNYGRSYHEIHKLLYKLNFNINSNGFNLWIQAIFLYKKVYFKYDNTIESIYHEIARKNNITRDIVEQSMRTASETAKESIKKYFKYTKKVTNKSILRLLVQETLIKGGN